MIRSSVDLPPPLGPSSAVSEPVGMSTETSFKRDEVAELLDDVAGRGCPSACAPSDGGG